MDGKGRVIVALAWYPLSGKKKIKDMMSPFRATRPTSVMRRREPANMGVTA
jgi:hypothetical protein